MNRRRWAAATAVALVAVGVLTGWVLFIRRADVTPLLANSVGPVDSRGSLGAPALLGSAPSAMVYASGAIWAAEGDSDAVVRIDPDDRRVTQTVRGVGRNPQAVAALGEDLWVVAFREKVVTRVDMTTAQAGHKIRVGTDPVAVAAGRAASGSPTAATTPSSGSTPPPSTLTRRSSSATAPPRWPWTGRPCGWPTAAAGR